MAQLGDTGKTRPTISSDGRRHSGETSFPPVTRRSSLFDKPLGLSRVHLTVTMSVLGYRLYYLDRAERIQGFWDYAAREDEDALAQARQLLAQYMYAPAIEVWQAKRFVARVTRSEASVQEAQEARRANSAQSTIGSESTGVRQWFPAGRLAETASQSRNGVTSRETSMRNYKCFVINSAGRIVTCEMVEGQTDFDAIQKGEEIMRATPQTNSVEVWRHGRLVRRIKRDEALFAASSVTN